MRTTRPMHVALVLLVAPCCLAAQRETNGGDEARVRSIVTAYLHGLKFNDIRDFQSAFWPDAKLLFVRRDSTIGQLSQAEWYKMFTGSAGKEEEGTLRIAALDITDNAASVKVIETYPKSIYVDYLNLLRLQGEWRIVNKIYTSRPR